MSAETTDPKDQPVEACPEAPDTSDGEATGVPETAGTTTASPRFDDGISKFDGSPVFANEDHLWRHRSQKRPPIPRPFRVPIRAIP